MKLNRVTISGVDDAVDPVQLALLTNEFPFVEWGVLLSRTRHGTPRYPTVAWMEELAEYRLPLSGHLCGTYAIELVAGRFTFKEEHQKLWHSFGRFQINFGGQQFKEENKDALISILREDLGTQFIFQCHNGTNDLLSYALEEKHCNAVPLFDKSGGKGLFPEDWERAWYDAYTGYAGGLGPDNVEKEIHAINKVSRGNWFWIDMESKVRDKDDRLDLSIVRKVLETCKPLVRLSIGHSCSQNGWVRADRPEVQRQTGLQTD